MKASTKARILIVRTQVFELELQCTHLSQDPAVPIPGGILGLAGVEIDRGAREAGRCAEALQQDVAEFSGTRLGRG